MHAKFPARLPSYYPVRPFVVVAAAVVVYMYVCMYFVRCIYNCSKGVFPYLLALPLNWKKRVLRLPRPRGIPAVVKDGRVVVLGESAQSLHA